VGASPLTGRGHHGLLRQDRCEGRGSPYTSAARAGKKALLLQHSPGCRRGGGVTICVHKAAVHC
jgi:hypothetical protein